MSTRRFSPAVLLLSLVGGTAILVTALLCVVGGMVAFRAQAVSKEISTNQKPWRLPRERPLPNPLREELKQAGAIEADAERPIVIFQDWIRGQEGKPLEVNHARFARAMEHSEMTTNVNVMNVWFISQLLKQSGLQPPGLNSDDQILSADWIVPNREARLILHLPRYELSTSTLYAVWLVKQNQSWQVYDWKDLLEPLTNAEYMAAYYEASPMLEDNMDNLMQEMSDIYYGEDTDEKKGASIRTALKSTTLPPQYVEYALFNACQYLLLLNQIDSLDEILMKPPKRSNLGREYFQTQVALHKMENDTIGSAKLFEQARRFVDGIGWYPNLGNVLLNYAETDDDKSFAKSLLIKDIASRESTYDGSLRHFRDPKDASSIWKHYSRFPDAPRRLVQLANSPLPDETRKSLAELASQDDRMKSVADYFQGIRFIHMKEWDQALPLLENLVWNESLPKESEEDLKQFYADSLLRSGKLSERYREASDKKRLLEIVRDHLLQEYEPYEDWVGPSTNQVLALSAETAGFQEDPKTLLLRAMGKSIQGDWSGSLDHVLQFINDPKAMEALSEGNLDWRVEELTSDCFERSNRWKLSRDTVENPDLFLLAFGSKHAMTTNDPEDPLRREEWNEMLDWYRDKQSIKDNLWTTYFESRLAFENGDWEEADDWIVKAIGYAEEEGTVESIQESSMGSGYLPFEYPEEIISQRMEMAFRSRRSRDWLEKISAESKRDGGDSSEGTRDTFMTYFHYSIWQAAKETMGPSELEKLIDDLKEFQLVEPVGLEWLRMELAKERWDAEAMWKVAIRSLDAVKASPSPDDSISEACILAAIASESPGKINEVEGRLDREWKDDCSFARELLELSGKRVPIQEISFAIKGNKSIRNLMIERKFHQNSESSANIPEWDDVDSIQGILLLNQKGSNFQENQLAIGLKRILTESDTASRLEIDRSDGAISQWRIRREDGIVLIGLYDRKEGRSDSQRFESTILESKYEYKDFQSALVITVLPYYRMHDAPALLTKIAQELSRSLETASGYLDSQSNSLLIGDQWREHLGQCNWVAINPNRPAKNYVSLGNDSVQPYDWQDSHSYEVGEERKLELRWGHVTETIPVTLLRVRSDGGCLIEFNADSKIDPRITRGWKAKSYTYNLQ